jgi:hypothetical protein
MMRYAHWLLPFIMPFVVLGVFRVLFWASGAPWSEPGLAAVLSLFVGAMLGVIGAIVIGDDKP